jgi:hypothetical protein
MVGHVELRGDFKEQAEWRREKAEQYPDDKRHLEAAAIFDRLAATVDAIPQDVFIAFSKLEVDDGLLDVERWTEMLRDWLWLVTENCRGICPILYRGSDDAAWITCSPLPATVDRRGDAGRLLHRLQQERSGARLFLLRGRPEGDRLLIDLLD